MTHHEFENALRSVKYTPEQRTAMREKLKNTMISGDRMPESDEPFAYTIENAFVEENEKMKITKKTVIGTIAACLIVGITGGVFAKLIINKNNTVRMSLKIPAPTIICANKRQCSQCVTPTQTLIQSQGMEKHIHRTELNMLQCWTIDIQSIGSPMLNVKQF